MEVNIIHEQTLSKWSFPSYPSASTRRGFFSGSLCCWKGSLPFSWGSSHHAMCRRTRWSTRCKCLKETVHCYYSCFQGRDDQGWQPPTRGISRPGFLVLHSVGDPEKAAQLWTRGWLTEEKIPVEPQKEWLEAQTWDPDRTCSQILPLPLNCITT
jgi:hypothetical protein